jgi:transcription termination factor Rho
MAVLHRDALEASPLADLHAIASELGLDGYRRLRKPELVERILRHENGDEEAADETVAEAVVDAVAEEPEARPRRRRGARGGRGRAARDADAGEAPETEGEAPQAETAPAEAAGEAREESAEGVVELLANGSGFVRVSPAEPSDGDVYISAAQVRRCELVSGDRISGPVRRPRRSERYPSLVRVDSINGVPAEEVAEGTPYEELPCAFPSQRFELGEDDPTLRAIEWLTPLGRGSRAVVCGPAHAGKTETLRRLAAALAGVEELEVTLVLAGVRPEEVAEWSAGPVEPQAAHTLASATDVQSQALDRATETAKRLAARGGHAVLLVDTLDAVTPASARRALAAARAIVDGGSVTVIATATAPLGGETTVIGLDAARTQARSFPAVDLAASGTLRPELLVGEAGAEALAAAYGKTE